MRSRWRTRIRAGPMSFPSWKSEPDRRRDQPQLSESQNLAFEDALIDSGRPLELRSLLMNSFAPIREVREELRAGRMIVLVDDENRENEGDLVMAAEKVTAEAVNFMVRNACGEMCLALSGPKCDELGLPLQTVDNTSKHGTNFTITIDAAHGIGTGTSAFDRARTILTAIDDRCAPADLARPGHIHPLRAGDGGGRAQSG